MIYVTWYANIKYTIHIPYMCRLGKGKCSVHAFCLKISKVKLPLIKNANMNPLLVVWIEIPRISPPKLLTLCLPLGYMIFFDNLSKTSKFPFVQFTNPIKSWPKKEHFVWEQPINPSLENPHNQPERTVDLWCSTPKKWPWRCGRRLICFDKVQPDFWYLRFD